MTTANRTTQATDNSTQHRMPQNATEYEKYLGEKFLRLLNSPQYAFYEGFLDDYYRLPKESDEFPGWVLPMKDCEANDSEESTTSAAGVPSRSEGAAALVTDAHNTSGTTTSHLDSPPVSNANGLSATSGSSSAMQRAHVAPITNRGATLYHNKSQSCESPCTPTNATPRKITHETPLDELPCPHIMGGYDGGVELGFGGKWPDKTFERITATLEAGRVAAQQKHNDARFIMLGGRQFCVRPYGGGKEVNYRYIIEGDGIKFYIHHKPEGDIQPIRLRYGFESLVGCNLFRVHDNTRRWLNKLGFVIEKETLSRVDLQVMIHRKTSELLRPIANGQMVTKVIKWSNHGKGNNAETFKIGGDIEICIYDKAAELLKSIVSDPIKYGLMTMICLGQDWCPNAKPATRVEFRLHRDALKDKGINTMQDLQEIEPAMVEWLTTKWFRILAEPKVRGHENKQAVHPIWQEVQEIGRAHV